MKNLLIILILFCGCKGVQPPSVIVTRQTSTIVDVQKDSVNTEHNHSLMTSFVEDTAAVDIAGDKQSVIGQDSSFLENDYCSSLTYTKDDGSRYHDLVLFDRTVEVPYQKEVVSETSELISQSFKQDSVARVDSIPYAVPTPYPVEKELNWHQKLRLWLGSIVLGVLLVFVGWKIFKLWK